MPKLSEVTFTVKINILGGTDGNVWKNRGLEADNTLVR